MVFCLVAELKFDILRSGIFVRTRIGFEEIWNRRFQYRICKGRVVSLKGAKWRREL